MRALAVAHTGTKTYVVEETTTNANWAGVVAFVLLVWVCIGMAWYSRVLYEDEVVQQKQVLAQQPWHPAPPPVTQPVQQPVQTPWYIYVSSTQANHEGYFNFDEVSAKEVQWMDMDGDTCELRVCGNTVQWKGKKVSDNERFYIPLLSYALKGNMEGNPVFAYNALNGELTGLVALESVGTIWKSPLHRQSQEDLVKFLAYVRSWTKGGLRIDYDDGLKRQVNDLRQRIDAGPTPLATPVVVATPIGQPARFSTGHLLHSSRSLHF